MCCCSDDMGKSCQSSFQWQAWHLAFHFERACNKKQQKMSSRYNEKNCIIRINRVEMTKMFVNKVIPEIKHKWPVGSKLWIIQQDNSKLHTNAADNAIVQALQHDHIQTDFSNQSPNSPDFNVLDLGFQLHPGPATWAVVKKHWWLGCSNWKIIRWHG